MIILKSGRYATEEGTNIGYSQPIFLREAICSVLNSLGVPVKWSDSND